MALPELRENYNRQRSAKSMPGLRASKVVFPNQSRQLLIAGRRKHNIAGRPGKMEVSMGRETY
jgi:hypothetical protein